MIGHKKYPGVLTLDDITEVISHFQYSKNLSYDHHQDDSVFKRYKAQSPVLPKVVKDKIAECVKDANGIFNLNIHSPIEFERYILSAYEKNDFLGMHHDFDMIQSHNQRLLTVVILLTNEFEGGEFAMTFQNGYGKPPHKPEFFMGDILIFPSWTQHQVLPVKSGTRLSLTSWVMGNIKNT